MHKIFALFGLLILSPIISFAGIYDPEVSSEYIIQERITVNFSKPVTTNIEAENSPFRIKTRSNSDKTTIEKCTLEVGSKIRITSIKDQIYFSAIITFVGINTASSINYLYSCELGLNKEIIFTHIGWNNYIANESIRIQKK